MARGAAPAGAVGVSRGVREGVGVMVVVSDGVGVLGFSGLRWADVRTVQIVTGDLHLGHPDSDGEWTLKEEAEGICAINRRSGRRYDVVLRERAS